MVVKMSVNLVLEPTLIYVKYVSSRVIYLDKMRDVIVKCTL